MARLLCVCIHIILGRQRLIVGALYSDLEDRKQSKSDMGVGGGEREKKERGLLLS